jgi:hypothetical protein
MQVNVTDTILGMNVEEKVAVYQTIQLTGFEVFARYVIQTATMLLWRYHL